jgi:RNA 2',3'-cyclic 3'-phosphodiesterase
MRVFIAIDIDDKIRKAIADLQKQIASKVDVKKGDLKWVEPNNIHLTLKFLGEISDELAAEVCQITKMVAREHQKFDLEIGSVGSFGGRSAKVVWVGVGKGTEESLALQDDLNDLLTPLGYPKEQREFSPHLTLCRVNHPIAGIKMGEAIAQFSRLKLGSIAAESLCVYQSQLTPTGPNYTLLASYKLAQN